MRKLLLVVAAALALAGCASLNPNIATSNQVELAINAYDVAAVSLKTYIRLPLCTVAAAPCQNKVLAQKAYTALVAGRAAKKQIADAVALDVSAPITALQALQAAVSVAQAIRGN